jgi:pyruvate,water dikinase
MLISLTAKIPEDLENAILRHYNILAQQEGGEVEVAVRSSALGEDLHGISFAGQYRSELNVRPENVIQAYKNVVASKYSLAAMAYRLNRGIRDEDAAICVGCMRMVHAVSGGVVYSRNPANIRDDSIIISSVWGLPKSVVDGTSPSDIFVVSRGDPLMIVHKESATKERKTVRYRQEGLFRMDMTAEEARLPSLSDEQVLEIARLAVRLETYSGIPQDIEWSIGRDRSIVLLQCRPLQQKDVSEIGDRKGYLDREPQTVILKGGITASPGVAAGPAFIVKNDVDALQFPDKAIMVAAQSLPRWAALLGRAAAVVTEQGGIAGHLATVAREFSVPALFGVKGAIEQLGNGQLVTVDADGRRVHRGHIDVLLKQAQKPKSLMEGSPVLEALKGAALCITPLTLLDPDSPEFKAKNCQTFHDITRFCHEKVLQEMFRFGKEHRLVERSGKKLICDLPMTYWVINLDDGFQEEVTGDSVHLDNVVSVPMLAFWEGLAAAPWKGPPPVRSRGLMSAFMEATMNPALEPSRGSHYATRNYCLISKNFCILQLRFNFHFCTVESYVGERAWDNYINFHFKGGAANLQRRMFRARLVAEILGEYDFRTTFKEDAAFAQLKGYDQAFMEERLKVLGYLAMHTRQLDLAMVDAASIDLYKAKMLEDLKEIVH